jgi:hypothetical protein
MLRQPDASLITAVPRWPDIALAAILVSVVSTQAAQAQAFETPKHGDGTTESVTVTAPRPATEAVIKDFVKSYAQPSAALGKLAKWRSGICPTATGLPPQYNTFVTQRIKEVAALVGAPINSHESCKINIDVVFTLKPQELLNNIRERHPILLGYHDTSQSQKIATVSHPMQAWYTTQTEDLSGIRNVDFQQNNSGVEMNMSDLGYPGQTLFLANAREERIEGSRIGDRLRTEFYHVVLVADLNHLAGYELGALADYITWLALAQTQSRDACNEASSITNLLASSCAADSRPNALSQFDLAYLRSLYATNAADSLYSQQSTIEFKMAKELSPH